MSNYGSMIAASADLSVAYGERLLAGVTETHFARLAAVNGKVIESNHPAFIYGHLSLYAPRVVEQVGGDASQLQPSEQFFEVFSKDAKCVDDASGTIYPPMKEVTSCFFTGYRAAADAIRKAPDAVLLEENPNEAMQSRFPTKGAMLNFYLGGHVMLHIGQMSAWRRMTGLGPA